MKSVFRKKTLKYKMFLILAGILLCFTTIYIAQWVYVNSLSKNYNKIEILTEHYNGIMTGTVTLSKSLNDYVCGNGTKEEINTITEEMQSDVIFFRDIINNEKYDRNSIDLANLIYNFTESSKKRIEYFDNKEYSNSIEEAKTMNKYSGYIVSKFAETDSSLRIYEDKLFLQNASYFDLFRIVLAFVCITMIVFFLLLVFFLWVQFLRPVSELSYATEHYNLSGTFRELCHNVDFTKKDEFGILASDILQMIEKLEKNVLLEQQNTSLKLKMFHSDQMAKEAQIKFLQARINPHFLFNSLNMIQETAYLEEADKTYEILETLGSFLRYNLDNFNKIVSVQKEVDNLNDYIEIQRKRLGGRIDFQVYYDNSASKINIPCLILQPLVENSVLHGVGSYKNGGKVWINIINENSKMHVSIGDNGKGMNKIELDRVRCLIDTSDENNVPLDVNEEDMKNHIGIRNVFGRLKLFYDNDIEVYVESIPHIKTEFCFVIPIKRKEQV